MHGTFYRKYLVYGYNVNTPVQINLNLVKYEVYWRLRCNSL